MAVRPGVVVGARMDAVCAAATVGAALDGARDEAQRAICAVARGRPVLISR